MFMGHFKLIGPGTDGLYKYGGATIELSSVGTRHWWATVRFSSQEIDFEAQSSQEALEKAMAWVDAAPEHPRDFYGRPRPLGETRYPKLPEPKHHFVSRRVEGGPPHRERKQSFAGYDFTSGPSGTTIHRQHIDPSAPGDYGADPLGDGKFRMVPSGDIVDFDERNRRLARKGGMREAAGHRVADFNTLDDLVAHARQEGATHVLRIDDEVHLYFKRRDGQYEKSEVWQKDGYWHTQGPGSRVIVRRPPENAKPIGGQANSRRKR
jgi:hypothetical protein